MSVRTSAEIRATAPYHALDGDWDDVAYAVNSGRTVTGYIGSPFKYLVRLDTVSDVLDATGNVVYGGAGDEGTVDGDDANAVLQAALANLSVGRTSKEAVYVIGDADIETELTVYSYTQLNLLGTLTAATVAAGNRIFVNYDQLVGGTTDIEINGGTLDGDKATIGGTYDLIYFARSPNTTFNNITFKNSRGFGLSLDGGCNQNTLSNCKFFDCGVSTAQGSIYLGGQVANTNNGITVKDCYSEGSAQHGIYLNTYTYNSIIDNVEVTGWGAVNNDADALSIRGNGTKISNCYLHDATGTGTAGIADLISSPADGVQVSNCKIYNTGSTANGITVFGDKWVISGCEVDTVGKTGIYIYSGQYTNLTGTKIHDCTEYGLRFYENASYNTISGCQIYDNTLHGVHLWDAGAGCVLNNFQGNHISGNGHYGVKSEVNTNLSIFVGNTLYNNTSGTMSLIDATYIRSNNYGDPTSVLNTANIATNSAWTAATAGTGSTAQNPSYLTVSSGGTNSSTAKLSTDIRNCTNAFNNTVDVTKAFTLEFVVTLTGTIDANSFGFIHLREDANLEELDTEGFGIKFSNTTISGESYDATGGLDTVALGTFTTNYPKKFTIILRPAVSVDFYVDNVYVDQITGTNVPDTNISPVYIVAGCGNGASDSVTALYVNQLKLTWG